MRKYLVNLEILETSLTKPNSVRMAAHLYAEHLLDREHYMDWLSTSLESCPLAKVPIWLLITQVYWNDLLRYRKYGSRLVAALCAHLQSVGLPNLLTSSKTLY
jgi:hypothetical protein